MKTCAIADAGSDPVKKTGLASDACFGVASSTSDGYQTSDTMNNCTLSSIVSPAEDIGLTGDALGGLPGCNPIQTAQPATIYPPSTCGAASEVAGGSAPAAPYNTATSAAAVVSPSVMAGGPPSSVVAGEQLGTPAASSMSAPSSTLTSPSETPASSTPSTGTSSGSGASPSSITVKNTSGSTDTWTYQGCYTDLIPDRNVRSLANWGSGQSSTECASNCYSAGYSIAGTEYGAQCFCGNTLTSTTKMDDSQCNTPCTGASSETCGGTSRLSIYAKTGTSLTKRSGHLHRHAARHVGSSF